MNSPKFDHLDPVAVQRLIDAIEGAIGKEALADLAFTMLITRSDTIDAPIVFFGNIEHADGALMASMFVSQYVLGVKTDGNTSTQLYSDKRHMN